MPLYIRIDNLARARKKVAVDVLKSPIAVDVLKSQEVQ
jgi:hypothetical protein